MGLRLKVLLTLMFVVHLVKTSEAQKSSTILSHAISRVFDTHYAKETAKIDVICLGLKDGISRRIAEEVLRFGTDSVTVRLSRYDTENSKQLQLHSSSLLLFDSLKDFKEINISWLGNIQVRHQHLVYIPNATTNDIVQNVQNGFDIDEVRFLMNETEKSIELVASFMFTAQRCRSNQLVTVNHFDKATKKWNDSEFFPKRYRKIHGCAVNIAARIPPYVPNITDDQDITTIMFALQKLSNLSFKGLDFRSTPQNKIDLYYFNQEIQNKFAKVTTSYPFVIEKITFIIPPGAPYSSFQKMFMMFDFELWTAIITTFVIALIAIQIGNILPIVVQNFVYGRNIRTPTINLISVFLNGAQFKIPGRNFARFLLMLFILWSLIIRTCYQSKLYELLQADIRQPEIQSIDELFEKNFTFWRSGLLDEILESTHQKYAKTANIYKDDDDDDLSPFLNVVAEPQNRAAVPTTSKLIFIIEAKTFRSGRSSLRNLNEPIRNLHICLMIAIYSPFNEILNEIVFNLMSGGILDYHRKKFVNPKGKKAALSIDEIGPQVLTMDHLEIGFLLHVALLLAAFIVFLIEIVFAHMKVLIERILLMFVIRAYIGSRLSFL